MTPNHDHASLFLAPPAPPADEAADESGQEAEAGAEAMRRLRDPFAVHTDESAEPAPTA